MKFYINPVYLTSVNITTSYPISRKKAESEEDFLVRVLTEPPCSMTTYSSEDHPEFARLRNELESTGHIITSRNSWNGDYVLRSFFLNDIKFHKGVKFPCGSAMAYTLSNNRNSNASI